MTTSNTDQTGEGLVEEVRPENIMLKFSRVLKKLIKVPNLAGIELLEVQLPLSEIREAGGPGILDAHKWVAEKLGGLLMQEVEMALKRKNIDWLNRPGFLPIKITSAHGDRTIAIKFNSYERIYKHTGISLVFTQIE